MLCKALRRHGLLLERPMPGTDKHPAKSHKDGQWPMEVACNYYSRQRHDGGVVGILLTKMIVLDFDQIDLYKEMVVMFPDLQRTVRESTRKGMHIFFLRTTLAEELQLLDGARQFKGADGKVLDLDLKTITGSGKGTSGYIVVAPSPGKAWVHSLLDHKPLPLPDDLARWLAEARHRKRAASAPINPPGPHKSPRLDVARQRPGGGGGGGRVELLAEDGQPYLWPSPALDAIDAATLGFSVPPDNDVDFIHTAETPRFTHLWHDSVTPCPICGDRAGHTSNYRMTLSVVSGRRWIDSFSTDCNQKGGRVKVLPFSDETIRRIRNTFEAQCARLVGAKATALAAWAERHYKAEFGSFVGSAGFKLGRWIFLSRETDKRYLVFGKVEPGVYTVRVDKAPWLGSRPGRKEVRDTVIPRGSIAGRELGDAMHAVV